MKPFALLLLLLISQLCDAQTEDLYGPVKISFHGFICNRPTNDDPLGGDGVSDEVTPEFTVWSPITNNRAAYGGVHRIYGEDFFLPNRIKAGTATINGGIKAGDSYYREGVTGDDNLSSLGKYDIVNTFCSNSTLIAIFPVLFERDEGPLHTSPLQDLYLKVRQAFADPDIQGAIEDFNLNYTYNDNNPYGFFLAGRHIGLDARFAGMFSPNKNKLASRPIGLFANWDYSSQLIVLSPKTIKIIAEKDYGYGKGILPVHFNEESMGNTEGHGNYIVLLRVQADIKDRNAGNTPIPTRSVTIKVDNAVPGEAYKFRINAQAGWDTVLIKHPNTTATFTRRVTQGQQYQITQMSGPGCQYSPRYGEAGATDILITANCAAAPTNQRIGVKINAVGDGEIFEFSAGPNKVIRITNANNIAYFPGTFRSGDNYSITQISGPRDCSFIPNHQGVVGNEDIIIEINCGVPAEKKKLKGKFTAPKGMTVTLRLNDKETLKLVQNSKEQGDPGTVDFEFVTALPVGSNYKVAIQPAPGTTPSSVIYENGEGVMEENIVVGVRSDKGVDLISRSTDNKSLNTYYESYTPALGGKLENEGRYVAFVAYGKGMDGSSGKYRQIFWRDRKLGITKLISKTPGGEEGNQNSYNPVISADGFTVAFETSASNLAEFDNNSVRDVFIWNESYGLKLISRAMGGGTANGESYEPVISGDGSIIAYTSNASNIVTLQAPYSTPNVYVHNGSSVTFISKDYETGKAVTGYAPTISEDGTRVAFCAYTNRLVKGDNNNLWDIFIWENGKQGLKRISLTATGAERNQGNESASRIVWPSISGDGNWIVYATTASNMVPGDDNGKQDIFICSSSGDNVRRISDGNGDSPIAQGDRISISYDGQWVAYQTNADNMGVPAGNILLQNTRSGKRIPITTFTNGSSGRPFVSRTGGYVAAGCSEKYDKRFASSGLFVFYTGH